MLNFFSKMRFELPLALTIEGCDAKLALLLLFFSLMPGRLGVSWAAVG